MEKLNRKNKNNNSKVFYFRVDKKMERKIQSLKNKHKHLNMSETCRMIANTYFDLTESKSQ